ncbi:MAG TPA: histidine phosphatase family protein [Candidatus Limnocylindria bacterium]|jgi:broad specificity phosphatase PhoE
MTVPETVLYFVRHGESEANAAGVFAGQTDSPLTPRGRAQAAAVAAALADRAIDRIVSSDLARAHDTAVAIADVHGLTVEIHPELREIDVGEAAGKRWDDGSLRPSALTAETDEFVRWPGGESLQQALDRSLGCIDRLVRGHPGERIVVVGHGGVTRILVSHFLGILPRLERSPATNTNVTIVRFDGERYTVEQLFGDAHLPT